MHVLKMSALLAVCVVASGCQTTLPPTPSPVQCEPVIMPWLPEIDNGRLWDALGDRQYRLLESYIDGLWGVIDEQSAIIAQAC